MDETSAKPTAQSNNPVMSSATHAPTITPATLLSGAPSGEPTAEPYPKMLTSSPDTVIPTVDTDNSYFKSSLAFFHMLKERFYFIVN